MSENEIVVPRDGLFLVSRTSVEGARPCDEAFAGQIIHVDSYGVDDPKKIPFNNGTNGDWFTKGTNHRIENGRICRDLGLKNAWFVELTDVMDFVKKYGECVVSINREGFSTIEIYDGYRE